MSESPNLTVTTIPDEIKSLAQWVAWKLVERNGKFTKVPINPYTGNNAKANDPQTWGTFEQALNFYENAKHNGTECNGIGFVFTESDPYFGVDLDKCCDPQTKILEPWAQEIIDGLNTYSETSQSGTGIHSIGKGKLPSEGRRKGQVEMYDRDRFFVITGNHIKGTPSTIEVRESELNALHSKIFKHDAERKIPPQSLSSTISLDDQKLLEMARSAKNGAEFERLWNGDTTGYSSQSEADLALCSMLAFWTGPDPARIDSLYRQSGLYREKWNRKDYSSNTINRAFSGRTEFYDPRKRKEVDTEDNHKETSKTQVTIDDDSEPIPEVKWPELSEEAFYGLAGDVVRTIAPHTESDPAAILIQFLVTFGSRAGRNPYFLVESDPHYCNLSSVLVGASSKARKGTSFGRIKKLFKDSDPCFETPPGGLVSGEGLIFHVRDAIYEQVKDSKSDALKAICKDSGVEDKRLLIYESEFSAVLKVLKREGNTLSEVLRQAWDSGDLNTLAKNCKTKATNAHVSLIGHITKEELRKELNEVSYANGFGNRILWALVKRSQYLPEGSPVPEQEMNELKIRLRRTIEGTSSISEIRRDEEARKAWRELYPQLSGGKPGLLGAMTSRGEAQTLRLSCIYALLDLSEQIRLKHLMAAVAVWNFCFQSCQVIFGHALGNPIADQILQALKENPEGLTRSEIRDLFRRHKGSKLIVNSLTLLLENGLIKREIRQTKGRPVEIWISNEIG